MITNMYDKFYIMAKIFKLYLNFLKVAPYVYIFRDVSIKTETLNKAEVQLVRNGYLRKSFQELLIFLSKSTLNQYICSLVFSRGIA